MPYVCNSCRKGSAKGVKRKGKKKGKKSKSKKGCRVAGVAVPKSVCGCVRREMKGVRADKDDKKKMVRNAARQCKNE